MKEKFSKGLDEKMSIGEKKEDDRLAMLEQLKKDGVPFTSSTQVMEFYNDSTLEEKVKVKRLKMDSSTTLPKTDPLFRIQVTQPNKVGRFLIFSFLLAYYLTKQ